MTSPANFKPMPDLDALRAVIRVNPQSGQFTRLRKTRRWTPAAKGLCITFNKVTYAANRLAYYLYHGEDPGDLVVDHIDGDRTNNRIHNLRAVTVSENNMNRKTTAKSGHKGVYALGRKSGYYVQYCRVTGTGEMGAKHSRDGYCRHTETIGKFPCLCTAKDAFINYVYSEGLENIQRAEALTPIPPGECTCNLPDDPRDLKPGDNWLNDLINGTASEE